MSYWLTKDVSYAEVKSKSAVPSRQGFLGDLQRLSCLRLRNFKSMKNNETIGTARYREEQYSWSGRQLSSFQE